MNGKTSKPIFPMTGQKREGTVREVENSINQDRVIVGNKKYKRPLITRQTARKV